MLKVGLLGLGTVGSGVYEVITSKSEDFENLLGEKLEIVKILVKNINKERAVQVPKTLITDKPAEILEDPAIDIIIETIGGVDSAYDFISCALKNKKHVVTANKAVVAKYLKDLLELSQKNNRAFLFEASVGGGIPIIKPLKQYAMINDVKEIKGILNGTSNFILTKMYEENISFNEALQVAQELGYAEADPTDDVEGFDAARKLAILSSIAFKNETRYESIQCRGISSISPLDFQIFKEMGCLVKLVGTAVLKDNGVLASVEPVLIKENSSFAMVKNAFNIVSVTGNVAGELHFYGQGAGKNPTANAVVSDVLDIVTGAYKGDGFGSGNLKKASDTTMISGKYYIRITPHSPESAAYIIGSLKEKTSILKQVNEQDDFVLITKELSIEGLSNIIQDLKAFAKNHCCVRIEQGAAVTV